jgi:hypothetical protein
MTGAGMLVAAVIVLGGYAVLLHQSRNRPGAAPLPLAVFPLALLFLITPVPLVALQTIRDFRAAASNGHADLKDAGVLAYGILRPLGFGCFGFLGALGVAAGLYLFGGDVQEFQEKEAPNGRGKGHAWTVWILCLSLLLILPAGALVYLMREAASVLVEVRLAMTPPDPQPLVAGMDLRQVSEFIGQRLVLGSIGGASLTMVVAGAAIASIVAHRYSTHSAALDRLSKAVTVSAGIFGILTLFVLTFDIRSFARLAP